jgi:hypothetical protein
MCSSFAQRAVRLKERFAQGAIGVQRTVCSKSHSFAQRAIHLLKEPFICSTSGLCSKNGLLKERLVFKEQFAQRAIHLLKEPFIC